MGFDERMTVLGPHVFDGVPLKRAAERAGVPLRTARRWLASYRVSGSAGLSRDVRSDRGSHRMPAELREVAEGSTPRTPEGSWRLRFQVLHRRPYAFTVVLAARLPLTPMPGNFESSACGVLRRIFPKGAA